MAATIDISAELRARFPQASDRPSGDHPAVNLPVADALPALQHLKESLGFDFLSDLTAIDWAEGSSPRFTVVYHLFSTVRHDYLRVAVNCPEDGSPAVPSVTSLWAGANWHEREAFDMFGIAFTGHPDLRRILMWEGYPYHPLRKEFPLAGLDTILPDADVAAETRAAVKPAPMVGGPFVASSGELNLSEAEPQAKDESWNERREKPE